MEALAKELHDQKELMDVMAEKKQEVERENEVLYEELNISTSTRKQGNKRVMALGVHAWKIVTRKMRRIFAHHKFLQKETLFKYSALDDGSYCARIRAEFEKAGLQFNKLVFRAVCELTVEWLVRTRAKIVTHIRAACLGEYAATKV